MRRILLHLVLVVCSALVLFPLVWMVLASLSPPGEASAVPPRVVPRALTLEHYQALFTRLDLARHLATSALLAATTTVLALAVNSMAGYAFAKLRFACREAELPDLGSQAELGNQTPDNWRNP